METSPSRQTAKSAGLSPVRSERIEGSNPSWDTEDVVNPFDEQIIRINGPYVACLGSRSVERRYMSFVLGSGKRTTMTYARWMMTQNLGRPLTKDEHVDHINEDAMDDRLENYQILSLSEHATKTLTGRISPFNGVERGWQHATMYGFMKKKCKCDECEEAKKSYYRTRNKSRREQSVDESRDSRGPYGQEADHGSKLSYTRGCRCEQCRRANAIVEKARRKGECLPGTREIII